MPESTPNDTPQGGETREPRMERHSGGGGDRGERREGGGYRGGRGGSGGGGGDRDRDGGDRGGRRPRRFHRGKVCQFCVDKAIYVDYKDLEKLRNYMTDTGKILPRRITGNCATHQRMTTTALKRARMAALLPYKV